MKGKFSRENVVRWVSRQITFHSRWILGGAFLCALFFSSFVPRLILRPDVDDFLMEKSPDVRLRSHLRTLFPKTDFIVVAFRTGDLFTSENLHLLTRLTDDLKGIDEAKDVLSLANANDMVGENDSFSVGPFLGNIPETPAGLAALRVRALGNPLFLNRLVSSDGRTASFVAYTRTGHLSPTYRQDLVTNIHKVLAPYESQGLQFHLAGWPITNYFLAVNMNQDLFRFMPITLILVAVTIVWVFRNKRLLLLSGLGIGTTVGATVGLTAALGVSLSSASAAAIPIVIALALSDNVHIFSHLDADVLRRFPDRRAALAHVLEQILYPCFLTSLNTAIGFFRYRSARFPPFGPSAGWLARG